jgi:dTDP-glucose 4,6-dehydratase
MSKKVLVTGGAGFIGHILIKYILDNTDWEVTSLDRLDYSGNLNRFNHMLQEYGDNEKKRLKIIYHDLKSEINNLIESQIKDVDIIYHLAASSHVDRSIIDPLTFVKDNVLATANILNYARSMDNLELLVYFSTDEVFGPAKDGESFKEWDRYNSTNPYSAAKAGGEELAIAFENTYDVPIAITHCMNVYGERQHPEKYIPNTLWKMKNNKKITIHANKDRSKPGSRHYLYAEDVASSVLFITEKYAELKKTQYPVNEVGPKCLKVNIPGTKELDNLEVAKLISDYSGLKLDYELVDFHSSRPGHDLRYAIDGTFILNAGWMPKYTVEDSLEKLVKWYLKNPEWLEF